jgi:hypothetical protein
MTDERDHDDDETKPTPATTPSGAPTSVRGGPLSGPPATGPQSEDEGGDD